MRNDWERERLLRNRIRQLENSLREHGICMCDDRNAGNPHPLHGDDVKELSFSDFLPVPYVHLTQWTDFMKSKREFIETGSPAEFDAMLAALDYVPAGTRRSFWQEISHDELLSAVMESAPQEHLPLRDRELRSIAESIVESGPVPWIMTGVALIGAFFAELGILTQVFPTANPPPGWIFVQWLSLALIGVASVAVAIAKV